MYLSDIIFQIALLHLLQHCLLYTSIKEKMASKKAKKDEVIDVESKDVTSDEETCEEEN